MRRLLKLIIKYAVFFQKKKKKRVRGRVKVGPRSRSISRGDPMQKNPA